MVIIDGQKYVQLIFNVMQPATVSSQVYIQRIDNIDKFLRSYMPAKNLDREIP